jgi:hypothetical protein
MEATDDTQVRCSAYRVLYSFQQQHYFSWEILKRKEFFQ